MCRFDPLSPALAPLCEELTRRLSLGQRPIVAIDGPCAAGKTTLAAQLHAAYDWSVVHMDHFFLRPEQRTPERYATPGGNIDHERLLAEVLRPLRAGEDALYCPYDCHSQSFAPPVRVSRSPVVLVEGSYSCHPALWDWYDLRVFLTIAPETQWERIVRREGPQRAQNFQERWIPLEEAYFSTCRPQERCDYVIP